MRSLRRWRRRAPSGALAVNATSVGEAVALGPNINAPMDAGDRGTALAAMDRAMTLRDRASPMERGLIEAAALRYAPDPDADRAALDAAYADVSQAFDYFLQSIDADKPIVLAGHSQGASHILRLLREKVAEGRFETFLGPILELKGTERFDFVSLSNIYDFISEEAAVASI